jgi:hypothetical protein
MNNGHEQHHEQQKKKKKKTNKKQCHTTKNVKVKLHNDVKTSNNRRAKSKRKAKKIKWYPARLYRVFIQLRSCSL